MLPGVYDPERGQPVYYLPKVLVYGKGDKEAVQLMIKELSTTWMNECQNAYLKAYFKFLPKVKVVALNELADNPEASELDWVIPEKES